MKYITDINQLDINKLYTYSDYLTWRIKERVELIMGKILNMSPAPKAQHQYISGVVFTAISIYLKRNSCNVFAAPFDVRLSIKNEIDVANSLSSLSIPTK